MKRTLLAALMVLLSLGTLVDVATAPTCPTPDIIVSNTSPGVNEVISLWAGPGYYLPHTPLWDMGNGEHYQYHSFNYAYSQCGSFNVVMTTTVECDDGSFVTVLSGPVTITVSGCGGPGPPPCEEPPCDPAF